MRRRSVRVFLIVIGLIALLGATWALAARPPRPGSGCPRFGIFCPDVYDPVTCDNGVTYPNACYAWVACATGCSEGGATQ